MQVAMLCHMSVETHSAILTLFLSETEVFYNTMFKVSCLTECIHHTKFIFSRFHSLEFIFSESKNDFILVVLKHVDI